MFEFLGSFSASFRLALFMWPFLAALLTLPLLVIHYRKYNKIIWHRILLVYSVVLYGLALLSFTLYPLPDNPALYCQTNSKAPLLNPLHIINDLRGEGITAIMQLALNVVFFVPLGFFIRYLFQKGLIAVLGSGFIVSLSIESAQLTGIFGLYPCSYRYFDVNDLVINTLGALIGYLIARVIPRAYLQRATKGEAVHKAGLLRHLCAFIIDITIVFLLTILTLLGIYLLTGADLTAKTSHSSALYITWIAVVFGLLPYVNRGRSLGGILTRLIHDDKQRRPVTRALFYFVRVILVILITHSTYGIFPYLVIVVILIIWWRYKKLPHQFIP